MARPIRDRLTAAARYLDEAADAYAADARLMQQAGNPESAAAHLLAKEAQVADWASAVKTVLGPGGWTQLRNEPGTGHSASSLPLTTNAGMRDALKAASVEFCTSLSSIADEGLQAALNGTWVPPRIAVDRTRDAKKRSSESGQRVVLNVRVQDSLRKPVQDLIPGLTDQLGYRVSLASIVLPWMAEELGVEWPGTADSESLKFVLPLPLREHVIKVADAQGLSLQQVMEDGIRSFLDGSWYPELPEWVVVENRPRGEDGKWDVDPSYVPQDPHERSKLTVRVDQELLAGLRSRTEEFSESEGYPYHPGMIAVQILKERLGEPDGV